MAGIDNLWWKRGLKHPRLGKKVSKKTREKISVANTLKPNLQITPDFAYFIGAFFGDGNIYIDKKKSSYYVRIYVGQLKKFGEKCVECLRNIGLHPHIFQDRTMEKYGYNPQWKVICYSKKLVGWLNSLTLDELYNLLNTKELKLEFIRGFADAEGTVFLQSKIPRIHIYNTNKKIIDFIIKILKETGFHPHVYTTTPKKGNKVLYQIAITRKSEAEELLRNMVKGQKIKEVETHI